MTIEIHEPELEALIERRMATGHFQTVEDALMSALRSSLDPVEQVTDGQQKQNFAEFLLASPLRDSGLDLNRLQDYPRPV